MKNRALVSTIMLIVTTIVMIILTGCNNNTAFKKATVTLANVKFSFEYPSSYSDKNKTIQTSNKLASNVMLRRISKDSSWENPDAVFMIHVSSAGVRYPDAEAQYNSLVSSLENADPITNTKIIETNQIQVAGINAFWLKYTTDYSDTYFFIDVLFNYEGSILDFNIESNIDVSEQVSKEFVHILRTINFNNS